MLKTKKLRYITTAQTIYGFPITDLGHIYPYRFAMAIYASNRIGMNVSFVGFVSMPKNGTGYMWMRVHIQVRIYIYVHGQMSNRKL